jgi:hypothetical protein
MPHPTRLTRTVLAFAGLVALTGCGSVGNLGGVGSTLIAGGAKSDAIDTEALLARPTCPPTEIRHGTETMLIFEPGKHGDPSAVRFQASVQRVARECNQVGNDMIVRVGAAGRVASGPKGATGTVTVPVRIAALREDQVIYSKLFQVPVDVRAPDFSALWTQVDDNVVVPADVSSRVTIYVGLDEVGDKAPKKSKKN